MAWTTSPWLTSMKYSFQDTQNLYIVMDFFPGGDLFSILEKEQDLDEDAVRFYLAEIAAGLHDLHQLGFVHRDVKPENVLIAQSGHIRLVDFGVAARVKNGKVVCGMNVSEFASIFVSFIRSIPNCLLALLVIWPLRC